MRQVIKKLSSLSMRHRKLMRFILLAAVAGACIHVWDRESSAPVSPKPRRSPAASISFQGYSNTSNGEKWALLLITNQDSCDLTLFGPFTLEFENYQQGDEKLDDQARWNFPNTLAFRAVCRASISIPPDPRRWKAQCVVQRNGWQSRLRDKLPDRLAWIVPDSGGDEMGGLNTEWISP